MRARLPRRLVASDDPLPRRLVLGGDFVHGLTHRKRFTNPLGRSRSFGFKPDGGNLGGERCTVHALLEPLRGQRVQVRAASVEVDGSLHHFKVTTASGYSGEEGAVHR